VWDTTTKPTLSMVCGAQTIQTQTQNPKNQFNAPPIKPTCYFIVLTDELTLANLFFTYGKH
jgi:hypothetical protein